MISVRKTVNLNGMKVDDIFKGNKTKGFAEFYDSTRDFAVRPGLIFA